MVWVNTLTVSPNLKYYVSACPGEINPFEGKGLDSHANRREADRNYIYA